MKKITATVFLTLGLFCAAYGQHLTYQDVKAIFLKKCVVCHRPGDAAPFTLMKYEDIAKRLKLVRAVINSGYMPPWKADIHYRDFSNNRSLSAVEKKAILSWIDNKAPKGISHADALQQAGEKKAEALVKLTAFYRKPDATLKIDSPYIQKGDNTEKFVEFKIPFEFDQLNNIEAIELYTNNKKILHHVNYGIYEVTDKSISINGGKKTINSEEVARTHTDPFGIFKQKMVYYTGWIPGSSYESYPKGFGWILPKRGVLIITAHYTATASDETSVVGVNLFFRKDPILRPIEIISLGSGGIAEKDITPRFFIPANKISTFHLKVKTNTAQSVMYIWPHMHLLGKEFYAYAVTPENDTIKLVHIPKWDYHWQELYKPKTLIKIPAGSVINMDCIYDNTVNNIFNPNNPPEDVFSFGNMSAKDEMMTLLLIYAPYKEGDENLLL